MIDTRTRERSTDPDVNKKQRAQFEKKPNVRWDKFEDGDGCVPAAEKQSHGESTNREHAEIFRQKKGGVFEPGIFRHVTGDDFGFAFRDIEWGPVGFDQARDEKQDERGRTPRRRDEPMRQDSKPITTLRRDNRIR